jgi:hypothetical protein
VALGVLGHLLDARELDRREEPPRDDHADEPVQDRQQGRIHVGRDLAKHLLGLGLGPLQGTPPVPGSLLDRVLHLRVANDLSLHLVTRLEGRPLDDLLLAVQEHQDRAPHLARHGLLALVPAPRDEASQIDGLADLHAKSAIGREERGDLGQVGGSRRRAVREVQEAASGTRPLPPEERQGHQVHRTLRVPDGADDILQQVEFALSLLHRAPASAQPAWTRRSQEQEERLALPRQLARVCASLGHLDVVGDRSRPGERDAERLEDRPVVVEADAVGEARQAKPLAQEERIEQEVVQAARVPHDVDDGAPGLEIPQALHGRLVQPDVAEETAREPAEEEIEARRHGRQLGTALDRGARSRGRSSADRTGTGLAGRERHPGPRA